MNKKNQDQERSDNLQSRILSDVLRGELKGEPVSWNHYQAKFPNRMAAMDAAYQSRKIEMVNDGKCALCFNGLVLLKTKEAKALLADGQKVFNFMRTHYRKEILAPISLRVMSSQLKLPPERSAVVVRMLNRDSGVSIGADSQPVTVDSNISASNAFLREKSFRKIVKSRRDLLLTPSQSSNAFPSNIFPSSHSFDLCGTTIERLGSEEVINEWGNCKDRIRKDSSGAIGAAKNLLESSCKQILQRRAIKYTDATHLPGLYSIVTKQIQLDPSKEAHGALRTILGGCATVVNGLAELRNTLGDGHGKAPGSGKPSQRHARLAVTLAGAVAAFLLETDDGRERP